jgi:hypothetical protein
VGSTLGQKAASALISVSDSSKHIIQIVQLLEERSMTFSFCLNKTDVLVVCGMTMLYQSLDLKQESKMMKDGEKLINAVIKILTKAKVPGSFDFKRIAGMLVTVDESTMPTPPRPSPEACMPAPSQIASPPIGILKKKVAQHPLGRLAAASASETDLLQQQEKLRRMTMPNIANRPELYRSRSRPSFDSLSQDLSSARRDHRLSMSQASHAGLLARTSPTPQQRQNLDYLSLSTTPSQSQPSSPVQARLQQQAIAQAQQQAQGYTTAQLPQKLAGVSAAEWEALLGSMDGGQLNMYDAIYGGPALSMTETPMSTTSTYSGWSPDSWDLTGFNIGDFGSNPTGPQSVLSMSDDSLSSGEEVAPSELGLSVGSVEYRNALISATCTNGDNFLLEGLDGNFRL